jgi:hypothetical protein
MILHSDQSQFHKHMWDVDVTSMQILYHQHTTFFMIWSWILNWCERDWNPHFDCCWHYCNTNSSLLANHRSPVFTQHISLVWARQCPLLQPPSPIATCTTQQLAPFNCYFPPTSLPLPPQIMLITITIQHLSISPRSSMLALAHLPRQMNCKIIGATEQRDQEKQRNVMPNQQPTGGHSTITIK